MNSKDLIKYGLIALGAYLVWKYVQDNGGISGLFGGSSLTSPTVGQKATASQLVTAGIKGITSTPDSANDTYTWNGTAWTLTACASGRVMNPGGQCQSASSVLTQQLAGGQPPTHAMQPITPAQIFSLLQMPCSGTPVWADTHTIEGRIIGFDSSDTQIRAAVTCLSVTPPNPPPTTNVSGCPAGQYMYNGVCVPTGSVPSTISQRMQEAAGTNSLNMDQWAFYYTQLTGQPSPVDPGSIDPSVYAGAGIVDRTTPTDVGTWLAIMQNQAPQLGLTGLGAIRYTPAWLM